MFCLLILHYFHSLTQTINYHSIHHWLIKHTARNNPYRRHEGLLLYYDNLSALVLHIQSSYWECYPHTLFSVSGRLVGCNRRSFCVVQIMHRNRNYNHAYLWKEPKSNWFSLKTYPGYKNMLHPNIFTANHHSLRIHPSVSNTHCKLTFPTSHTMYSETISNIQQSNHWILLNENWKLIGDAILLCL